MNNYYSSLNYNEKVYQPIEHKTFKSALQQFFKDEVPQIGGEMIIGLISDKIQNLIDSFYTKTERLSMGQMLWFAIDEKEKPSYGKSMSKTKIKPVILTIVHPDDITALKNKVSILTLKEQIIARLYRETKKQGAVLAESDISLIMHITGNTVSKRTTAYEKKHNVTLPRRGTIHDLGRSLSHKRMICKKRKLQNKSISQIARETDHTPQAITRYTTDLNRVQFCLNKKLSVNDVSFVTNLSPTLTIEYLNLIDEIKQKQKEQFEEDLPF
jgi:hypothetical protein